MLRKGSETTAHVAGFGLAIRGLRPSDTSKGFFDSLNTLPKDARQGVFIHLWGLKGKTKNRTLRFGFGTPSGTRTLDTLIKSQVLYQLS